MFFVFNGNFHIFDGESFFQIRFFSCFLDSSVLNLLESNNAHCSSVMQNNVILHVGSNKFTLTHTMPVE